MVTLADKDYLYVIGTTAHVISGYQLNAAGNATANTIGYAQQGDTSTIPKLAGIAAFVQTKSASATVAFFTPTVTIVISMLFIYFGYEQNI